MKYQQTAAKTTFALALIAFMQPSQALQIRQAESSASSCDVLAEGEIRPFDNQSQAMEFQWVEGRKIVYPTSEVIAGELFMRYCADLTIRDRYNNCVQARPDQLNELAACDPANRYQQFTEDSRFSAVDNMGYNQFRVNLKNRGSGYCMGPDGSSADFSCMSGNMWRVKGDVVYQGRLQNVGTLQCLKPVEEENQAKVVSEPCENEEQADSFTLYQDGEIIHDASGMCLGKVDGQSNDLMILTYCQSSVEQGWIPEEIEGGYYFHSMADADKSLTSDAAGTLITRNDHNGDEYQQWRFISADAGEFAAPTFDWIEVGCDNGVDLTHMYQQAMYMVDSDGVQTDVDDSVVDTLKQELADFDSVDNLVPVASDSVLPIYDAIADMVWHPSDPYVNKEHAFNCGEFEDGTLALDGGCLWRAKLTAHNWYLNEDFIWHTPFTKCTQGGEPQCPPYTRCSEDGCSECVFSGFVSE